MTSNPRWRGINHLALITPDMDATVRFYHGALGMPIVATINAMRDEGTHQLVQRRVALDDRLG